MVDRALFFLGGRWTKKLAISTTLGLEPRTSGFVDRRSIQLSHAVCALRLGLVIYKLLDGIV